MVKSGVEKMFLKFLHAQSLFGKIRFTSLEGGFFHKNSVTKMTFFAQGDFKKKICVVYVHTRKMPALLCGHFLDAGAGLASKTRLRITGEVCV